MFGNFDLSADKNLNHNLLTIFDILLLTKEILHIWCVFNKWLPPKQLPWFLYSQCYFDAVDDSDGICFFSFWIVVFEIESDDKFFY